MKTVQDRSLRYTIYATQCFGFMGGMLFANGFLLALFDKMGFGNADTLNLLATPQIMALFIIPCAFVADRIGAKKIGFYGLCVSCIGFSFLLSSCFIPSFEKMLVVIGVIVFSVGGVLFGSSWFALLDPLVPSDMRGRFFAYLRISWQTVAIIAGFIIVWVLGLFNESEYALFAYGGILFVAGIGQLIRLFLYLRIPAEQEEQGFIKNTQPKMAFKKAIGQVMALPGYMPYCSYIFLISLCTGACPLLFGLLEKDALGFDANMLVVMGTILQVTSVLGFWIGGRMVDSIGTRPVFLICHFGYAITLALFLTRDIFAVPYEISIGCFTGLFGFFAATVSIAVTSEMMALLPETNKSLATGMVSSFGALGMALSAFFFGKILESDMLARTWQWGSITMTAYDSILITCAVAILLLTVTLSLIPSVIKKAQWVP